MPLKSARRIGPFLVTAEALQGNPTNRDLRSIACFIWPWIKACGSHVYHNSGYCMTGYTRNRGLYRKVFFTPDGRWREAVMRRFLSILWTQFHVYARFTVARRSDGLIFIYLKILPPQLPSALISRSM